MSNWQFDFTLGERPSYMNSYMPDSVSDIMDNTMQNKDRFPVLALAGYFKPGRLVGEACEDLSEREGANGLFFTHSDHIVKQRGSSSWTTDADGRAVQHMEYLPFGEELLNQRATSYSERYTFTGKELDEESNLYYYDARYNSSTYSQFNSIDPMSDKYPSVNPYLYCAGNPIKYIDPTGMEFDEASEKIASKDEKKLNNALRYYNRKLKHCSNEDKQKDIRECIKEINTSLEDIKLMRETKKHRYIYELDTEKNEGDVDLDQDDKYEVTIHYGKYDKFGLRIHENRHRGDMLRGTLTKGNYSRKHEISAYRAQYAARRRDFKLFVTWLPTVGAPHIINNINEINNDLIDTIVESWDNPKLVYHFPK